VFHREGTRIGDFRKVWDRACTAIGLSGRIVDASHGHGDVRAPDRIDALLPGQGLPLKRGCSVASRC